MQFKKFYDTSTLKDMATKVAHDLGIMFVGEFKDINTYQFRDTPGTNREFIVTINDNMTNDELTNAIKEKLEHIRGNKTITAGIT